MKKNTKRILIAAAAGLAVTALCALDSRLTVRTYEVTTEKLTHPVRLALVTDLHSCRYGDGQKTLLAALDEAQPDVLLLSGDIVDARGTGLDLPVRRCVPLSHLLCDGQP